MASLLLTDNRKGKCAMTKRGKKKGLVAALSVVAVIVLLAAAYGIFCLIIEDDKIWADPIAADESVLMPQNYNSKFKKGGDSDAQCS